MLCNALLISKQNKKNEDAVNIASWSLTINYYKASVSEPTLLSGLAQNSNNIGGTAETSSFKSTPPLPLASSC